MVSLFPKSILGPSTKEFTYIRELDHPKKSPEASIPQSSTEQQMGRFGIKSLHVLRTPFGRALTLALSPRKTAWIHQPDFKSSETKAKFGKIKASPRWAKKSTWGADYSSDFFTPFSCVRMKRRQGTADFDRHRECSLNNATRYPLFAGSVPNITFRICFVVQRN